MEDDARTVPSNSGTVSFCGGGGEEGETEQTTSIIHVNEVHAKLY